MTNRVIRVATVDDIPALLNLAEKFVSESSYGMEFDEAGAAEYLESAISHPDAALFVTDDVDAGVLCSVSKDFCTKPVCYIEYFYVSPTKRGTGVARVLMQSVINFARLKQAAKVHAFNHCAMGDQAGKMFHNLLRKVGFVDGGFVSLRVI